MSDHVLALFEASGGELRRHVKVARIVTVGRAGRGRGAGRRRGGHRPGGRVQPRSHRHLHPAARPRRPARGLRPAGRGHRPPGRLLPDALRLERPARVQPAPTRCSTRATCGATSPCSGRPSRCSSTSRAACGASCPRSPSFNLQIPTLDDPELAPAGKHAASSFAFYFPIGASHAEQTRLRDEMAGGIVAKMATVAPNFPDLIERQFNYPAYTYELMFGCTGGDFTHGLLQPEFMGPFRPGPRGWPDNPVPVEGLYLCGAGCHGGPGVTFIPGYNCGYAVLDAVSAVVADVADLALDEGQVQGHGEGQAGEEAHHEEDPGDAHAPPATVDDRPQREQDDVDDGVVLGGRVGGPVGEEHLGVVDVAGVRRRCGCSGR